MMAWHIKFERLECTEINQSGEWRDSTTFQSTERRNSFVKNFLTKLCSGERELFTYSPMAHEIKCCTDGLKTDQGTGRYRDILTTDEW